MNRRGFLKLFGAGLPAVVVAEKAGLIEKATKYFLAPRGGWLDPYRVDEILKATWTMPIEYTKLAKLYAPRFYAGQEITLYDSMGNPRSDSRMVITSVDTERNIVNFDSIPLGVQPGDLMIA